MCGSATGLDIVFLEKKNALMASINKLKQNITFFQRREYPFSSYLFLHNSIYDIKAYTNFALTLREKIAQDIRF